MTKTKWIIIGLVLVGAIFYLFKFKVITKNNNTGVSSSSPEVNNVPTYKNSGMAEAAVLNLIGKIVKVDSSIIVVAPEDVLLKKSMGSIEIALNDATKVTRQLGTNTQAIIDPEKEKAIIEDLKPEQRIFVEYSAEIIRVEGKARMKYTARWVKILPGLD